MALYLRSPGYSAKLMILLLLSVCTRICADLNAVHHSPCWDRITRHPHMITCHPCCPAVSCYTPPPHDYMPSVPPKPTFLLLVMLESWHPTFARLFLHQAEEFVSAPNDESVYTRICDDLDAELLVPTTLHAKLLRLSNWCSW